MREQSALKFLFLANTQRTIEFAKVDCRKKPEEIPIMKIAIRLTLIILLLMIAGEAVKQARHLRYLDG